MSSAAPSTLPSRWRAGCWSPARPGGAPIASSAAAAAFALATSGAVEAVAGSVRKPSGAAAKPMSGSRSRPAGSATLRGDIKDALPLRESGGGGCEYLSRHCVLSSSEVDAESEGATAEPASELPEEAATLCGGSAFFTSIHLPRIRWLSCRANAVATAAVPSGPGRKQTKPKPRDLLVAGSIMTTASDTMPKVSKWSLSSPEVVFCGRPPTKSLLVPGTARFTSTLRPPMSCTVANTASGPVATAKVT
mmetsp:Transcript_57689/g.146332  ORF Transcript_57689/g.146332 Transcript_57689/m.146332 type:complete len:249 (+) Transcript_57689:417-1163(+)